MIVLDKKKNKNKVEESKSMKRKKRKEQSQRNNTINQYADDASSLQGSALILLLSSRQSMQTMHDHPIAGAVEQGGGRPASCYTSLSSCHKMHNTPSYGLPWQIFDPSLQL